MGVCEFAAQSGKGLSKVFPETIKILRQKKYIYTYFQELCQIVVSRSCSIFAQQQHKELMLSLAPQSSSQSHALRSPFHKSQITDSVFLGVN